MHEQASTSDEGVGRIHDRGTSPRGDLPQEDSALDAHAPGSYGDETAHSYDDWFGEWPSLGHLVERVTEFAGPGPVLELGIGTGPLALPLLERGIAVHGIDTSEQMVARLRAKPGGERIPVTIGDFAELPVTGSFSVVFVAKGSFFHLPAQDEQLRCFANVARRLQPGGVFILDGLLPDETCLLADQGRVIRQDGDARVLRFRRYDRSTQRLVSHYVGVEGDRVRHLSFSFRYAWPGELDLMARMAGLHLRERWGGWDRASFTENSTYHVSVYELSR
jgi:SAM-dependent methyltransferase